MRIARHGLVMREVVIFPGSDSALLHKCQELRYQVYGQDLGLDTPDLDHARSLDIEERDPVADFAAVMESQADGTRAMLGCIRMQPPGRAPYYAELEFALLGPSWRTPHVEGARFAVLAAERDGPVPLMLFQAFRRYCRERSIDDVLSVAIAKGKPDDRGHLARLTRFLLARVERALDRGRPAPGYEIAPPTEAELADAGEARPDEVSPMLRLLANPRTTLASPPAYCRRFGTFNFLLTTRLR